MSQRLCGCGCGRSLAAKPATAKYFSARCGSRARRAHQRQLRDVVLAFFAEPAPEWRRCEECGQLLAGQRKDARFCSTACRRAAARGRVVEPTAPEVPDSPEPRNVHPLRLPASRPEKRPTVREAPRAETVERAQTPEIGRSGYEKRAESSHRRPPARIEDLRYVARRWRHDEITPCTYCGAMATEQDHVLPRAYLAKVADLDADLPKHMLIVVPSCGECNRLAGADVFPSLRAKRAFLRRRIAERYAEVLSYQDFTSAELDELGPDLRAEVERGIALKAQVRERLRWADRRIDSRRPVRAA